VSATGLTSVGSGPVRQIKINIVISNGPWFHRHGTSVRQPKATWPVSYAIHRF